MDKPLISIIIPFYNTGDSLISLLKRLLTDKYENLQIICVDDKSTDDSFVTVKKFIKYEKNVLLLQNSHNGGASSARNLALSRMLGKYVVFIDSDDSVSENYITDLVDSIENKKSIMAVCGICQNYLHERKKINKFTDKAPERGKDEPLKDYVLRTMCVDARLYSSINKIYRADIIKRYKIRFDEELNFAEDTKFVLEYLRHCPSKSEISYVRKPNYIYNYGTVTSTVISSSLLWRNWKQSYKTIQDWYGQAKDLKTQKEFKKLLLRFKISHALAVERSALPYSEKKKYATGPELLGAKIIMKLKK